MKELIRGMIESALVRIIEEEGGESSLPKRWNVEIPKRSEHGDYATNVAMVLASRYGRPPMVLAEQIVSRLDDTSGYLQRVEIQPPGFINFFLQREAILERIRQVLHEQEQYGRLGVGQGRRVQVEFVSANPTGPLHIGHGRGAAVGDALARVLEAAGYKVFREYYVNDVGRQMEILGRSVYLRYLEMLGQEVSFPEDHYRGEYILELAREILERDGSRWVDVPEEEAVESFSRWAGETILEGIRRDLEDFRVHYDRWFRESSLHEGGKVSRLLERFRTEGLVYEKDGALWFRATHFGDEKDRVVVRSDGRTTYFASDIAYHADKFERGFDLVIDVWGADHHGYVPRMKGMMRALGREPDDLQVLLVQLVNLLRDGQPVSMSTRAGQFATLREVMEEVGVDAARYIFLMRSSESHLDFDLEVAKRQERENPVYYVQYAHARICSILKEAHQRNIPLPRADEGDLSLLRLEEEWELVKHLVLYPEVIKESAQRLEPHRLTFFLDRLAADFHSYYNRGWLDPAARVICNDPSLTRARLLLVQALRIVLRNALELLGVSAPEEM